MPATAKAHAPAQLSFDWLLGSRAFWRINEVANLIGMSPRYAEKLYDEGQLYGHSHNAGDGIRHSKTVCREAIAAYLCKTATYTPEMRVQSVQQIIDSLTPEQSLAIAEYARRRATQRR